MRGSLKKEMKRIPLRNRLPMTRIKLVIAHFLYRFIRLFIRNDNCRICRKGIYYDIDLSEGIDLSLFLFGHFQICVVTSGLVSLREDSVIFDVGANIGSMALAFAQKATNGRVYAFEPTDYAYRKLVKNISLNPGLRERITTVQTFIGRETAINHNMQAYSSWKIDKKKAGTHHVHGGSIMETKDIGVLSIDDFCSNNDIKKVDLIKIDTDGYEYQVLTGAEKTLIKHSPTVLFEIGIYILEESHVTFEQYLKFFDLTGYRLMNSKNSGIITRDNYMKHIPLKSTIDIIALHHK